MRRTGNITVRTTTLPRPGARARTLVGLDRESAQRYTRAVTPVVGAIEERLGPQVLAARVGRMDGTAFGPVLDLAAWRPAHRRFRAAFERFAAGSVAVAATDVRACYESIADGPLAARLRKLGCARADTDRVLRILDGFHQAGVRGLPIGPDPSAVLANAVLSSIDTAVAAPGVRHLRWVDDVFVFARDERRARSALERIGNVLADLEMRPATEKTLLIDPREAPRWALHRTSMSPALHDLPL